MDFHLNPWWDMWNINVLTKQGHAPIPSDDTSGLQTEDILRRLIWLGQNKRTKKRVPTRLRVSETNIWDLMGGRMDLMLIVTSQFIAQD